MDTNASTGRFYAFTTPTSATLPSTASSPDPQYRRDSSGSDSVSDEDGSASQLSHPSGRAPQGYGGPRAPYGSQNAPPFSSNRAHSTTATIYVDDPPYVPPSLSRPSHPSTFVETGPDVPFNPPIPHFHPGFSSSVTSTTVYPTPFRRAGGENSPTGSHGSGRSDHSGGQSGSSHGSASSGVVSSGSQPRDLLLQGHDVFPPSQRVVHLPAFNPHHYPAYDEHSLRRVGMEHARFGTDPLQAENAYYRPRTHTYPAMGAPQMPLGMESPENMQLGGFHPSPEMQLLPMDAPFDRDVRQDSLIPGQTRIHLPQPVAPQSYDNFAYNDSSQSHLRVGDDSYIPTSDADIRRILGLSSNQELSLNALADPPAGQRPGQSIPTLSQLAILGSQAKRLTLQEIYQALEDRFEWFSLNRDDKSWQNSIRHNLSLYKCFRRIAKPITEPGKGSYWVVDYSRGSGTKRPRKRNKRPTKAQLRAMEAEKEAQGSQEVMEEGDSSADDKDDDEGFPSPTASPYDIPIDPVLQVQGHQVGQGRARNLARSVARRGNSPYAPPVQASAQQGRRQASAPAPFTSIVPSTSRHPSATFGQPSFGQPSLGPTGLTTSIFGQPSMGNRVSSGAWPPIMNQQTGQMFLPPPHPRAMGGPSTSAHDINQASHGRTNTARAHILHDMGTGAPYVQQLPPLHGMDQMRDASGRFVARGTVTAPQYPGESGQQFVQGPSRSGRRTSSSSNSSRD